ncbi:MAG TPA: VWA domain-containing protein, partial [Clostridiales bacterium]|nr:VWA domain-containing protein [Clostridiales bacterium]
MITISVSGCKSKDMSKDTSWRMISETSCEDQIMDFKTANADWELLDDFDENFNTEEYNAISENGFKSVRDYPLSTFAVDVDTASYSNIRRMINDGAEIVPDAVRIEEMVNYFKYDYKKPTGDVPFSVTTELSDCPWNEDAKLLLIGLQAKDIDLDNRPSSNLVFLIDVSGSMDGPDRLPLMQKAFIMLTENLNENDRVSIVTYAGADDVLLDGVRGNETMKIVEAVEDLYAGGSTAGAQGINRAYELAEKNYIKEGNNRIILATDGDLNVGVSSEGELTRLVKKKKKSGVYLSVLGFGAGNIKDNKMEALADNGNGNYSYIDSLLEAKKVLVDEMGGTLFTVADDVKLQVEFNPTFLKGYRLIGYENRLLNAEDFDDDTKDAGEIGAGHRVTALYELVATDSKQKVVESNLKYQSESELSDSDEWLTINIRYKEPTRDTSQLLS